MDRTALKQMLDDGLSLAEIGRRVGRHESTVAYWMAQHGLEANGRKRHAAEGAIDRERLEVLVNEGLSAGQIAESVGRSKTTVRHWLREYGLTTAWGMRRRASVDGERELILTCTRHGSTTFLRRSKGGYRCAKCRAEAVSRRRRKVKQILVGDAGGSCRLCGYDRCIAALEFHHVEPTEKRFSLSHRGVARSLERARAEARKCILLCSNCHAEVEAGAVTIPGSDGAVLQCLDPGVGYPG
jgi:transposase